MKEKIQKQLDVAVLMYNIAGMLTQRDYIAWVCWDDNLEYLVTDEKKLIPHDNSFVSAWVSAKLLSCSYERNRLRILNKLDIFNPHADLRRK